MIPFSCAAASPRAMATAYADRLSHRNRAGRQPLAQRLPFEQLRDDERRVPFDADVVHRQDVRMAQRRGGACFLLEALQPIGSAEKADGSTLIATSRPEPRVARAIHLAHPARAKWGDDRIGPEAHPGG